MTRLCALRTVLTTLGFVLAAPLQAQVTQAPTITKSFATDELGINGISTLTFTIQNPNNDVLQNIEFTDTYPAGLVNTATPAVTNTCGGATSGGVAGGNTIGLTGKNNDMAANTTCTVTVDVTSAAAGSYNNTSGAVTGCANNGCSPASSVFTGNTASATITYVRPTVTKSFSPTLIVAGGTSTLTVTLANDSDVAFTAAGFTDTFPVAPGAMTVAAPLTTTNSCGGSLQDNSGGALAAGDPGIGLAGGTIPAHGTCTITVAVTASASGTYTDTIVAGAVSTSGGTNAAAASATLDVTPPLTLVKSSSVVSDPFNGITNPKRIPGATVEYTVVVANPGSTATADTVVVIELVPANATYVDGSLVVGGTTEDDDAAGADETDPNGGDFGVSAAGTVTVRIPSLAAGASASIVFRVTND